MGLDFVVYPTTVLGAPLGAACVAWLNNDYGWLQYRGPGVARGDAAAGVDLAVQVRLDGDLGDDVAPALP